MRIDRGVRTAGCRDMLRAVQIGPSRSAGRGTAALLAALLIAVGAPASAQSLLRPLDLSVTSALPLSGTPDSAVLQSELRFGQQEHDWLFYDARYALEPGALFEQLDTRYQRPSAGVSVGRQVHVQRLGARFELPLLGPLVLDLHDQQTLAWSDAGTAPSSQQQATLGWSPSAGDVRVQWSAPTPGGNAADPLDCGLTGELQVNRDWSGRLPLIDAGQLSFAGRHCSADLGARGADTVELRHWTGSWTWGDSDHPQTLTYGWLDPQTEAPGASDMVDVSAQELIWSQRHHAGLWTGNVAVGVRSVNEPDDSDTHWIARADLQRRLRRMEVTASWRRASDPLWFAAGYAAPTDEFGLGLNLAEWMGRWLGENATRATLSYRWRDAGGVLPNADQSLNWRFAWIW